MRRHLAAQLGQNLPAGHFSGSWIMGPLALGRSLRPRACSRCTPIRATDVVASRHRIGGPHASAGTSRRAPSFRPARFQPALNCRARAKTPFYTCPGASCLPLLRLARVGLGHSGLGGAEACGRRREAAQALLHHRGCGERLSGVSKGPHGSYIAKPRWRFPRARACISVLRLSRKELQPAAACSSMAFSISHSTAARRWR